MSFSAEQVDKLKHIEQERDHINRKHLLGLEKYLEFTHAERLRSMDYMKDYGTITIRSLLILNGGAIIALLTLVGALFSKAEAQQILIAISLSHALTPALLSFGLGLALVVAAAGIAYINFSYVTHSYSDAGALLKWLSFKDEQREDLTTKIDATMYSGIVVVVLSLLAFCLGAYFVFRALSVLGVN